jgi:hypothetical protein
MKKLFKTLGICALALPAYLASTSGAAQAVTGSTNLTIIVPEFIVLYYPTALTITLADVGTAATPTALMTGTEAADVVTPVTLDDGDDGDKYSATKALTINNVWAVRGLTPTGTVKVAITPATAIDLTHSVDNTKKITIPANGLKVADSDNTTGGANITTALNGMTAVPGNIKMTLNMSSLNATGAKSGSYSATGAYTITVTST